MKPLRVTFRLRTPMVVPDFPIHLDSVLAAAAVRTAERSHAANPLDAMDDLPLGKSNAPDGEWVWQASQLLLETQGGLFWTHYVRRFELDRWAADRGSLWVGNKDAIPAGTGHMKAFAFVTPLAHVRTATAWCIGDPEAVDTMLRAEIHSLGRNSRMGWGWLSGIEVAEDAEAHVRWRARALPHSLSELKLPGHFPGAVTVRPPYFKREARQGGNAPAWDYDASAEVTASCATGARSV